MTPKVVVVAMYYCQTKRKKHGVVEYCSRVRLDKNGVGKILA
jgi:hypothetical protein